MPLPRLAATSLWLLACACRNAGGNARNAIEVAPGVQLALGHGWRVQPQGSRNLTELVRDQAGQAAARASITSEPRKDHDAAVQRLRQIAAERAGNGSFIELCGWPALVRRARVALAPPDRPSASDAGARPADSAELVSVAVAAAEVVVRLEGQGGGDGLLELARALTCPAGPDSGTTHHELESLRQAPRQ